MRFSEPMDGRIKVRVSRAEKAALAGQSGNPNGRPAGSRSKVCVALDALAEGEAEQIVTAMIASAKGGDGQAGRTILERIWPPRKGARLDFDLPEVTKAEELPGHRIDQSPSCGRGYVARGRHVDCRAARCTAPRYRDERTCWPCGTAGRKAGQEEMNLNSRLSKLETGQGLTSVSMVIVAEDEADFDRQFEDGFLSLADPCRLSVSGTIAGVPFQRTDTEILAFEDYLELLS